MQCTSPSFLRTDIGVSASNYKNISEVNGNVPMVQLKRLSDSFIAHTALMKMESCNPTGSIKDKNASYLINLAESRGYLKPGGTIIESSSGNFGIALAALGASRGYKVVIVIDAKTSQTMRRMLLAYGAYLEEVPLSLADGNGSMQKARMAHARALAENTPGSFYPCQHLNPDNPSAHYLYTGREVLLGLPKPPDAVVVGVSTCGQLTGMARYLRAHAPSTKIVAVDVSGSVVLGTPAHSYKMTGLGLSFVPPNFDPGLVDIGYAVGDELAFSVCHMLAKREGLLLGGSTGAIVAAAMAYLKGVRKHETVVMINPDRGDRYLDTIYNPDWIAAQGLKALGSKEVLDLVEQLSPVPAGLREVRHV